MSAELPTDVRGGASHWAAKMLASGRFAMLQVSLALYFVLAVSALVMVMTSNDEKVLQCSFGLLAFCTGQIGTVFGFYLRGGSNEN